MSTSDISTTTRPGSRRAEPTVRSSVRIPRAHSVEVLLYWPCWEWSTRREDDLADKRTGLREAQAVAEYDQAQAAAMAALADARAFLLVTGNERFELGAHTAVMNAKTPSFLVAATAMAACCTQEAVYEACS